MFSLVEKETVPRTVLFQGVLYSYILHYHPLDKIIYIWQILSPIEGVNPLQTRHESVGVILVWILALQYHKKLQVHTLTNSNIAKLALWRMF